MAALVKAQTNDRPGRPLQSGVQSADRASPWGPRNLIWQDGILIVKSLILWNSFLVSLSWASWEAASTAFNKRACLAWRQECEGVFFAAWVFSREPRRRTYSTVVWTESIWLQQCIVCWKWWWSGHHKSASRRGLHGALKKGRINLALGEPVHASNLYSIRWSSLLCSKRRSLLWRLIA